MLSDGRVSTAVTGRRQANHTLWIMVLLWHTEWTQNKESGEHRGCCNTSHPLYRRTFLSVSAVWVCSIIMYNDGILQSSISEWVCQHDACASLYIYLHLMVTFTSTCHVLSNIHTPFPMLPHFWPKKIAAMTYSMTLTYHEWCTTASSPHTHSTSSWFAHSVLEHSGFVHPSGLHSSGCIGISILYVYFKQKIMFLLIYPSFGA
jgi:hypothetical protein